MFLCSVKFDRCCIGILRWYLIFLGRKCNLILVFSFCVMIFLIRLCLKLCCLGLWIGGLLCLC